MWLRRVLGSFPRKMAPSHSNRWFHNFSLKKIVQFPPINSQKKKNHKIFRVDWTPDIFFSFYSKINNQEEQIKFYKRIYKKNSSHFTCLNLIIWKTCLTQKKLHNTRNTKKNLLKKVSKKEIYKIIHALWGETLRLNSKIIFCHPLPTSWQFFMYLCIFFCINKFWEIWMTNTLMILNLNIVCPDVVSELLAMSYQIMLEKKMSRVWIVSWIFLNFEIFFQSFWLFLFFDCIERTCRPFLRFLG